MEKQEYSDKEVSEVLKQIVDFFKPTYLKETKVDAFYGSRQYGYLYFKFENFKLDLVSDGRKLILSNYSDNEESFVDFLETDYFLAEMNVNSETVYDLENDTIDIVNTVKVISWVGDFEQLKSDFMFMKMRFA